MRLLFSLLLLTANSCFGGLIELVSAQDIQARIEAVAQQINTDYAEEEVTILMVMKGAVPVTADLMRHLQVPCKLEFIQATSYRGGTRAGELKILGLDRLDLADKNILVVDDIFDTGRTMETIVNRIAVHQPRSVKSLVFLQKKVQREMDYTPDYVCFHIPDEFVVGYGLDYQEYYRNLPAVYTFEGGSPTNER